MGDWTAGWAERSRSEACPVLSVTELRCTGRSFYGRAGKDWPQAPMPANAVRGRSREYGGCGLRNRCFPALTPAQTERWLRDQLSENCGIQSCSPADHRRPSTLKESAISLTAVQPFCEWTHQPAAAQSDLRPRKLEMEVSLAPIPGRRVSQQTEAGQSWKRQQHSWGTESTPELRRRDPWPCSASHKLCDPGQTPFPRWSPGTFSVKKRVKQEQ